MKRNDYLMIAVAILCVLLVLGCGEGTSDSDGDTVDSMEVQLILRDTIAPDSLQSDSVEVPDTVLGSIRWWPAFFDDRKMKEGEVLHFSSGEGMRLERMGNTLTFSAVDTILPTNFDYSLRDTSVFMVQTVEADSLYIVWDIAYDESGVPSANSSGIITKTETLAELTRLRNRYTRQIRRFRERFQSARAKRTELDSARAQIE